VTPVAVVEAVVGLAVLTLGTTWAGVSLWAWARSSSNGGDRAE
jgi:hypothetical protein